MDFTLGSGNSYPHLIGAVRPAWVHLRRFCKQNDSLTRSKWKFSGSYAVERICEFRTGIGQGLGSSEVIKNLVRYL
jgi:hypothetical protein